MSFLYPAFLIGAALIAIPIALHLLRRDVAPAVPFTAVRLLRRSPVERSRRRRLRDILLLAARVAALLLLAAAFARPYLAGGQAPVSTRIVAIDRSYSMGAPGQFERALDLARASIDAAGVSQRVAIVAFDERAVVVAQPGGAGEARAALADLRPGFQATRYGPVFLKASELAEGGPASLVLVTDLQRAGWEDQARALIPEGMDLQIADTGAPAANLALVSARMEGDRLYATVRNAGAAATTGDVRIARDRRAVASARFSVGPDALVDVPLAVPPRARGALLVTIDDPSGFQADNARFVTLDSVARPALLIVTSGDAASGFYLARAIEAAAAADPAVALDPRLVPGTRAAAMSAEEIGQYRAIALLSTRGLDRRARASIATFVRSGGGLLAAASPELEPSVLSMIFDWQPAIRAQEQPATAVLAATDLRHPIFQPFGGLAANLGQVRFERSWRLQAGGWHVAARFTDGTPALVERAEGKGRVVLFASDLDRRWNDFPLHPSFVPFAIETLRHVSGPRDDAVEYHVGRVPSGVRAEPGVYPFAGRTITVNVDPREATVARMSEAEFRDHVEAIARPAGAPADLRAQQAEERQGYWRYALMLMLAVLVVESAIGKP